MWAFDHPLRQFDLQADLIYNIEQWADECSVHDIAAMSDFEFGAIIHLNERLGGVATAAARQLPSLSVSHSLQPITHDLLRVRLELRRQFDWNEKRHGPVEAFWVWVEDEAQLMILQVARVIVRQSTKTLVQEFVVPITSAPSALYVRIVSDRWLNDEEPHLIDLTHLVMPPPPPPHLPLLDLPLLLVRDAFKEPRVRDAYGAHVAAFDPVQTLSFHNVYHTSNSTLVCAPSAPSRGTLLELAIWCASSCEKQVLKCFTKNFHRSGAPSRSTRTLASSSSRRGKPSREASVSGFAAPSPTRSGSNPSSSLEPRTSMPCRGT